MGTIKFTKTVLQNEVNARAIIDIQEKIGRNLEVDEVFDTDEQEYALRGLCNGKQCADGEVCVLGNCIKDDLPQES